MKLTDKFGMKFTGINDVERRTVLKEETWKCSQGKEGGRKYPSSSDGSAIHVS